MTAWATMRTRLRTGLGSRALQSLGLVQNRTPLLTSAQRLRQLRISYELLHGLTMDLQEQLARWSGVSWPQHLNALPLPAEPLPLHSATGKASA